MPRRSRTSRAMSRVTHDAVSSWAADLPDSYLQCRDFGHTWRPFRASYDAAENGYRRIMRCGRCKAQRSQLLGLDGSIRSGAYDYADGYTKPAGTGVLDQGGRGTLRLESTLRLIGKDEQASKNEQATA